MGKFILIDHSIRKYGGHYYEYAIHVLKAARENGLTPYLAANREFKKDIGDQELIEGIFSVYKYDFWGHSKLVYKQYSLLNNLKKSFKNFKVEIMFRLRFSTPGFIWTAKNNYREIFNSQSFNVKRMLWWYIALIPVLYVSKAYLAVKGLLAAIIMPVARGYLGKVLKAVVNLVKIIVFPVLAVFKYKEKIILYFHQIRRIRAFSKATEKLFRVLELKEEDIVFIPTLSEIDLMGLLYYFKKNRPAAAKPSWGLIFRRNIYNGREPEYTSQMNNVSQLRNVFLHFRENLAGEKVVFYTDTEKLTGQYDSLGVFKFHTLPIPVNEKFQTGKSNDLVRYPLKAVYAGDARREKGYQYIPGIVRDLWDEYVETGKLIFVLQSNFAFNRIESNADIVLSRDQLERMQKDKVIVIKEPLPSEKYCDLILNGDIGLLMYDRDNYYARSSGGLVEFLSAGKPVIVPAGTWLAEEFILETYRHHRNLINKLDIVDYYEGTMLKWGKLGNEKLNIMSSDGLAFGKSQSKSSCWLEVPEGTEYLLISFRFEEVTKIGSYVQVYTDQLDINKISLARNYFDLGKPASGNVSGIVRIHPLTKKIWLGFSNAYGNFTVSICDIKVYFLKGEDSPGTIPLGSVGLAYSSPDQIPELLENIMDNYEHYSKTARDFSSRYILKHNAGKLVEILMEQKEAFSGVS